ncbi:hypothetical protein Tco_1153748 [Tanacetum coccineum]
MSRRQGYMLQHMRKSCMPRHGINTIAKKLEETLKEVVPKMAKILSMVVDAVKKEQKHTRAELASQVSNDIATNVPLQYKYKKPSTHVDPCKIDAFRRQYHDDHHDDDALPEEENKQQEEYDPRSEDQVNDDDEVPSEVVTPEFLAEISKNERSEEHAHHLYLMKRYMENHIVCESRLEDLTLQVPEKPTLVYQGCERDMNAPPRLIYEDSKKDKRVMDIDEIPKFYDATLKRVLEKMKKINLDVKNGYQNPPLSKEDTNLMIFYEEYIQERLKH